MLITFDIFPSQVVACGLAPAFARIGREEKAHALPDVAPIDRENAGKGRAFVPSALCHARVRLKIFMPAGRKNFASRSQSADFQRLPLQGAEGTR
jgi:hypothetical protein